jgi:hypothetical protein
MAISPLQMILDLVRGIPREAVGLTGFALAFVAVVAGGVALDTGLVSASPLAIVVSYGVPGALAFGLYLTLMRRD